MTRDLRGAAAGGRDGGPLVRAVPGVTRGRPPAVAAAGLRRSGHPAYGITQLSADLERFAFLLGGSDGEPLFGHPPS